MSKTKPNRVYHKAWDKYGDVLSVNDKWVTCRFDGEKGSCCYEVDAPFIKMLILEENPKPEPIVKKKLLATYDIEELLKDRERLEWLIAKYDSYRFGYNRTNRKEIDKEMEKAQ